MKIFPSIYLKNSRDSEIKNPKIWGGWWTQEWGAPLNP
jgi:hypothetical protein